jgi:hypothetical protein
MTGYLIGRGLGRPDLPDRYLPNSTMDQFAVQPRRQRLASAVPLHDKHVFDMHM